MSDIAILKKMLHADVLLPLQPNEYNNDKYNVRLAETVEGQEIYDVLIKDMPSHALVIKSDAFPNYTNVLQGNKGERKRSDFIIIAYKETQGFILYIELKETSKTVNNSHIIKQFKGSQCVIAYCKAVAERFWGETILEGFKSRFVCISNMNEQKQTSSTIGSKAAHDQPENMLKIKSNRALYFKKMIGQPNYQLM